MLCDGKILVQRFGDFVRGRRTTEERLIRNNITPTLKDAVPGDLSLVFPYRIMKDIEEMIYALDEVTIGGCMARMKHFTGEVNLLFK